MRQNSKVLGICYLCTERSSIDAVVVTPKFLKLKWNIHDMSDEYRIFWSTSYSYFEKGCLKKKSTKVHATRPKGSMGRSIELLKVLNTNEIQRHDKANLHVFFLFIHMETRYF